MDDWFQNKPVYTGPTTDQMDHTTPEERYKLVVLCLGCGEWHHFKGSSERFLQSSVISERTWNPNAKKAKFQKAMG